MNRRLNWEIGTHWLLLFLYFKAKSVSRKGSRVNNVKEMKQQQITKNFASCSLQYMSVDLVFSEVYMHYILM